MAGRLRVYPAAGVILRRRNLGEADSILTVFSKGEGKFEAVARGVRKARSRMRGHLEPLTHSRLLIARGRSLDVFTQAETVNAYRRLRENLDASAEAVYCLELIDRFTEEREPLPDLYALLLTALDLFEEGGGSLVSRHFELRLLAILGYEPHVESCVLCGGRLPEEETLLAPASGGLACRQCRPQAGGGRLVPVPVIKMLRFARRAGAAEFAAVRMAPELERELRMAVTEILRYHLARDPNAREFVDGVNALQRHEE